MVQNREAGEQEVQLMDVLRCHGEEHHYDPVVETATHEDEDKDKVTPFVFD